MKRKLSFLTALCIITVSGCSTGGVMNETSEPTNLAEPIETASYSEYEAVTDSIVSDEAGTYSDSDYVYEADTAEGCYIEGCLPRKKEIQSRAGLLTGGEWNDNDNFDFWAELLGQREEWKDMSDNWEMYTLNRTRVHVSDKKGDAENVTVTLEGKNGAIWSAVTDNTGTAYLFSSVNPDEKQLPTRIVVSQNGNTLGEFEYNGTSETELVINTETKAASGLDLMFVIDSTGSMGDELSYLKTELMGVIERVSSDRQTAVRLCTEYYRDEGNDYVVQSSPFTFDIARQIYFMKEQFAAGGGDYPEAVVEALEAAVYEQQWDSSATKLLFLVLDAPPHYTEENLIRLRKVTAAAAENGIRIIPVAASGVDTDTEFLCRSLAVLTGGTYTFLTDHSGIGNSHLEPTVGYYQVEYLDDMLVRIIESYL